MKKILKFLSVPLFFVVLIIGLFGGGKSAEATCGVPLPHHRTCCGSMGRGNIEITKYDAANSTRLPGAQFTVYCASNKVVQTITTNASGVATLRNVPYGRYNIIETKAPEGYVLDQFSRMVTISACGKNARLNVTNRKQQANGTIQIEKKGNDGKLLEDAIFKVENDVTGTSTVARTDRNGKIVLNGLKYGTYTITETKAPTGYKIDTKSKKVLISSSTPTAFLSFLNKKVNDESFIVIEKKSDEGIRLAGGTFEITGIKTGYSRTETTGADGRIRLSGLGNDTYRITETKAPTGYILDSRSQYLVIDNEIRTGFATFVNRKANNGGFIRIEKKGDDGKWLSGAEFRVRGENTGYSATVKTGADGIAVANKLKNDTYNVEEIKAPAGYVIDKKSQRITISNNAPNGTLSFMNKKSNDDSFLVIEKQSDEGIRLAGATFEIIGLETGYSHTETTGADGRIRMSGLGNDTYRITETKAPEGYIKDARSKYLVVDDEIRTGFVTFINNKEKEGMIYLELEDKEGNPLAGAEFTFAGPTFTTVATTDANGKIKLSELPYGTFKVTQTKAPKGYVKDPNSQTVVLSKAIKAGYLTFVNEKEAEPGFIKITKKNEDGKVLPGAKFRVEGENTGYYYDGTTNRSGTIELYDLPYDSYKVTETKAPEGYEIDTKSKRVLLKKDTPNGFLTFINKKEKEVGLLVLDLVDPVGNPLEGGEFKVQGGDYTAILTTDANGRIELTNLPYRDYVVTETKAPEGYEIEKGKEKQEITLTKTSSKGLLTFVNKKEKEIGQITIIKTDKKGNRLAGAEFKIEKGKQTTTHTTNAKGVIELKDLPYGDYKVTETKAPEGFILNKDSKEVKLTKAAPKGEVTFVNEKEPTVGYVSVELSDELGNPLKNGEFKIQSDNFTAYVTTDDTGNVDVYGLPYEEVTVTQLEAPKGYIKDDKSQKQKLTKGSPNAYFSFVNKKEKDDDDGIIEILKVNGKNEKLPGAEFEVKKADGTVIKTKPTNKEGKIELKDLPYGEYTVSETKAPEGYKLDSKIETVILKKDKRKETLTFINVRTYGSITVVKQDEKGNPLSGAEFTLKGDNYSESGTSDDKGLVEFDKVPLNEECDLWETKAPDGYVIGTELTLVELKNDNPDREIIIINKKEVISGKLKISVADEKDNALKGAKFDVFDPADKLVAQLTTNATGEAEVADLLFGDYYLRQTEAPEGYTLDTNRHDIKISKDDPQGIKLVKVVNKKIEKLGSLKIIKIVKDSDPVSYLKGAEFSVFNPQNELVGNYTTNDKGFILLKDLEPGTYSIVETKAPNGYEEDTNFYDIVVEAGKTSEIKHANEKLQHSGTVKIKSYEMDDDENATTIGLAGARFKLVDSKGKSHEVITGQDGEVSINLPAGDCKVTEIEAPLEHELTTAPQTITVVEGETAELAFYNQTKVVTGRALIYVTSDNPDTNIKGLEYIIESAKANSKFSVVLKTNKFGQMNTYLRPGDYTIKRNVKDGSDVEVTPFNIRSNSFARVNLKI